MYRCSSCIYIFVLHVYSAQGDQRRTLDPLDLDNMCCEPPWKKPRSSPRAANALIPWATSLAYESFLWVTCKWQRFHWNPTLSGYKIHAINNSASIVLTFLSVLSISYLL